MYTEYQPCGLLSAYIDKYWVFKGKTELGTYFKILPDGAATLSFPLETLHNVSARTSRSCNPIVASSSVR